MAWMTGSGKRAEMLPRGAVMFQPTEKLQTRTNKIAPSAYALAPRRQNYWRRFTRNCLLNARQIFLKCGGIFGCRQFVVVSGPYRIKVEHHETIKLVFACNTFDLGNGNVRFLFRCCAWIKADNV